MKFYSLIFRLLITANGLLILTIAPAWSDNGQQVKERQVRVTTGIGAVQGWEQGLVQKNPNLGRWHWDPIYYYKQGYGPVRQKSSHMNGSPTGKQSVNAPGNSDSPDVWHDTKPVHIPYSPQAMAELHGRVTIPKKPADDPLGDKETVLGKLMSRPPGGETIATYGKILPERENSVNTGLKYSSQTTAVYGQLLNQKAVNKNHSSRKGQTSRGGNGAKKNQ